jgi:hypothetical protein
VRGDVLSGTCLLLLAVGYGVSALRIPRGGGEPGPGALPIALALTLAVLAVFIVAQGRGERGGPTAAESDPGAAGSGSADEALALRSWLAALATLGYVCLFHPLGFAIATPVYVAVLAWLFRSDGRMLLGVSVGVTVGLLVFFRLILGVRLPPGFFA